MVCANLPAVVVGRLSSWRSDLFSSTFQTFKVNKIKTKFSSLPAVVRDLYKLVDYFSVPKQKQTPTMPHLMETSKSPISPTKRMSCNNSPFIVSIEGNIGAGKSTMLQFFKKYSEVELIPEPVSQWCNLNGHNLLGKLYEDPKRWEINVSYNCYDNLVIVQGGHFNSKAMSSSPDCSFSRNLPTVRWR